MSTAPSSNGTRQGYTPTCLDLSSMVLSALLWQENCGSIKLYTDNAMLDFLTKYNLDGVWDGGIDVDAIEAIPDTVYQKVFWSAAKLYALQAAEAPVAMVDNDLFIWRDISNDIGTEGITVLHREELIDCYVSPDRLGIPLGYAFDSRWDWSEKPLNMAFAYFPNNGFKNRYVNEAIRFMDGNRGTDFEPSSQMVFAEQRIIAMVAKCEGVPISTLIDDPFDENNVTFTHLWGAKSRARSNKKEMDILESAILKKIQKINTIYYTKIKDIYNKY